MKSLPTAPAPGTPVSSSLIRELIDAIRARTLLRGPGYRTHETPNGLTLEIEKTAAPKSSRIPGLFEPTLETDDNGDKKVVFKYPYYMVGTRLYRCEDERVTVSPEEGVYCLVVNLQNAEAGVEKFADFAAIQTRAANPNESLKLLFEFGEGGSQVRDFRNMPTIATQEFPV